MQNYQDGAIKVVNSEFYSYHLRTYSNHLRTYCSFLFLLQIGDQHADMLPNKWQNGAQCCFSMFDCRLFMFNFFVKTVCILLVSFGLIHFHKSSPTLLHAIYLLVFRMPSKWKWPETNIQDVLAYAFGFKSCSILAFW